MTTAEFLRNLRSRDVALWIEGDRLRYSAAPGALTDDLRAELTTRKEEILQLLAGTDAAFSSALPCIKATVREGDLPLSFAQERLWFLEQLEPGTSLYNLPVALRLRGPLNADALEAAFQTILARHEALRTRFKANHGHPAQVIASACVLPFERLDLSVLPAADRDTELRRCLKAQAWRPFDLTAMPLIRVALMRLNADEHVLVVVMHHIVSDDWSVGVLLRELGALYGAHLQGAPSPLTDLPIQYADFAVWQRECLKGEVLERELAYWRDQLAGELPIPELPFDHPCPRQTSSRGAVHKFELSPRLADGLRHLSRREGATLFMTLLAGFQTLLHRYTRQDDILAASPVAGRNQLETENLIGFFVNLLVLRTDFSGDPTFRELLARVRQVALAAYAHQDLPFERLVAELQPERSLQQNPLTQVLFVLQNVPTQDCRLGNLTVAPVSVEPETAKFPLTLEIVERPAGLSGQIEYRTDLFGSATIERTVGHWITLLQGVVTDPNKRLSALPWLSDAERCQLVVDWNATGRQYPRHQCIHQLFEDQVRLNPDATALVFGGEKLTYGELNRRANRLAHHLRGLGIGPEVLVGICLERSLELVIGLLGILKAGGAYLPLDPTYPQERLAFMLAETRTPVLLTQRSLLDALPPSDARRVCLDADWDRIAGRRTEDPSNTTVPDNLAYVIYTSGSTGQPKGVSVNHRGVVRLVKQTNYARFAPDEVFLQLAPISFDASTFEIWGALCNGARLVIFPPATPSLEEIGDALARYQITTLWLTSALFQQMVERNVAGLRSVRQLLAGGDVLSVPHVQSVLRELPHCRLINGYGPTESTTFTCCAPLNSGAALRGSVPIGRPIANTQVFLLDGALEPVPIGVHGELYIGGDGLARGYLQSPELTAERFIPHPFGQAPGERVYKTGDVARFLADGQIEFLGRKDHQVKIRGFRIELGEIETVLGQHPGVRENVVVAREEVPGNRRLVAYLVPRSERAPTIHELRDYLKTRLPDYMVPSAYVVLAALPLTPNGKVDRRGLPAPDRESTAGAVGYVAPRTGVEEVIAGIWAEVLRVGSVGVEDNFFELGGHSLLATQVISRVNKTFQVTIPLRRLFEAPTVAGLAQAIVAAEARPVWEEERIGAAPESAITRRTHGGPVPLSFAQERLWFIQQLEPTSRVYHIQLRWRVRGPLNVRALEQAFEEFIRRHESLRTTIAVCDGRPVQIISAPQPVKLSLVDLAHLPEDERDARAREMVLEQTDRPFDLTQGPLVRVGLVGLGAEDHVLAVTVHHIISDGWSCGILFRECTALYEAFNQGRPSSLLELPIQYADYAQWQREWLQGPALESQLAYWRRQLAGTLPVLELPADYARPTLPSHEGAVHTFALATELTEALKGLSRREGVTLFMTLLAAFDALLLRHAGQDDLLVGSPIAGRSRVETEGIFGLFVNTLVLRANLSGNPTFRELLQRVREVALGAYAHQELPFEKLVEELRPERRLGHNPLFQVMFAFQNMPTSELNLGGLTLEPFRVDRELSMFDLSLVMFEAQGQLVAQFDYTTDLFKPGSIQRIAERFQTLLEGVVAHPDWPTSRLPLLPAAERQQLIVEWNDTRQEFPKDLLLRELFEAQVTQTPAAVAVVFEDRTLTYGELNQRANQLARRLQKLGVGPEVLVGLYLERSVEMVVGLFAVLKAGGAYVPLDPAYPTERIVFMIADAAIPVLLTQAELVGTVPKSSAEVLALDRDWPSIALEDDRNLSVGNAPENVAYVIYTSGSTGRPKGAAIPHRAICNHMRWMQRVYPLTAADSVLQKTPFSFDASVWEFYAPLFVGGRLIMARPGGHLDCGYLTRTIQDQNVTTLQLVPSLLRVLLEEPHFGNCKSLRRVFCGGEALPVDLQESFFARLPIASLHNLYGPTEAAIDSTSWTCHRDTELSTVPIGRPVDNAQAYIVDGYLQPAPPGVLGELLIGGAGLARGYVNRPELTAERFVPDPFGQQAGARLYRTGDLARYRADGNLEFLGRIDHQVKIRGFRIELGEIEAVLQEHPAVREAVVVAREDEVGSKRLVAYVVVNSGVGVDRGGLQEWLKERLPEYMVPSAYVVLAALPLTPNGKVDRRGLPAPDRESTAGAVGYVAPRTGVEEVIAGIWAEVLRVGSVGVEDNFFGLGGHSLLATQVISRVRETFGVELPLRALFEAPTIASLARRIAAMLREHPAVPVEPIRPVSRAERLRPSLAQERLWFLDQLEPGNPVYNIPLRLRLQGRLDVIALNDALREILRRHEVLRTNFQLVEGEPFLDICPEQELELPLPVTDLSGLPESHRDSTIARLVTEAARHRFDLAAEPLIRVSLLRLGSEDHTLLVVVHHIVFDGWSVDVFLGELARLYNGFSQGGHQPLPELLVQYADCAVWQRGWLQGPVLERELTYWRQELSGAPPLLELPTDRPRPPRQTYAGGQHNFVLPPPVATSLRELGQRQGATLFMTVLAAFQTLLYRYTQQTDFVVGSPIAGRDRRETEPLVGFFVNTLALRCRSSERVTFRELLRQVQEVTLEAYAHQWLPFDKLVEELNPERNPTHDPIFQVMLVLQNKPERKAELVGLISELLPVDSGLSQFDLMLLLTEEPTGLSAAWVYSRDLFEASTIDRMTTHFETLLAGIVRDPDQRIGDLPLMSDAERRQLVVDWNRTGRPYPRYQCLHELVEERARLNPQAIAVVFGREALTYGELNRRANRLAHRLHEAGAGPEVLVGVCTERGWEMMLGLLAVLKAGSGYVPLDPRYPAERLAFMLEDTGAAVLLTQRKLLADLPRHRARVVCLEELDWAPTPQDESRAESGVRPDDLAYVIYTSGSTGRPKGVAIEHRSAVTLIHWAREVYPAEELAGVLFSTSICFDLSVFELFVTLSAGGKVILAENVLQLPELPAAGQVTLINTVPSAMTELLRLGGVPRGVRVVNLAGEPLKTVLVDELYGLGTVAKVYDLYGPSEDTTYSTFALRQAGGVATIGRPIANTQVYLLDAQKQPVPVGVPGEIYIGGEGLARGYLGRAEATAERFVPDPFGQQAGARLYRTGDLARYRADGHLEFLGRTDHQVKVRGFRIELGEIESLLNEQPEVQESVCVLREDLPGDQRLVGYVVPRASQALDPAQLRSRLAQRLPGHMVPSVLVALPGLPLTPNGKVDRRGLPKPESSAPPPAQAPVGPRSPCEEVLGEIWTEVLGARPVCIYDNFFDVGGHSLLAIRLISRLRDTFKVNLPLRHFFESPTIAGLASCIEKETHAGQPYSGSGTGAWGFLVPIQPVGSKRPFYLFPGGLGSEEEFLVYAKLARHLGLDQPFYGLKARSGGDHEPPHRCVEDMARDYVEEIRELQPHGPYLLVGECAGGIVAFEAARQLVRQGEQIGLLAFLDTEFPRRHEYLLLQFDLMHHKFGNLWPVRLLVRSWFHLGQLRRLPGGERWRYLREKGRLGRQQVAAAFTPAVQANPPALAGPAEFHYFKTLIRYRPKKYPGRVTLLLSEDIYRNGRAFGWRHWADGGLEIRTLPGNHLTYIREHVAFAAAQLLTCLRQAQTGMPAGETDSALAAQTVLPPQS